MKKLGSNKIEQNTPELCDYDVLNLIWDKCRRMPMYAIEKCVVIDETDKTDDEDKLEIVINYKIVPIIKALDEKNSDMLNDFVENILQDKHFHIVAMTRNFI